MKKTVILIGFGPHARRIYYPFISHEVIEGSIDFCAVVDLQSKAEEIREFFLNKSVLPHECIFIPDKGQRIPKALDNELLKKLDILIKKNKVQYAVIATEPKAHEIYIRYFLQKGIPVLTDKPLTAPVGMNKTRSQAAKIYSDAVSLYKLAKKMDARLLVQCQRREHPAYIRMFDLAGELVSRYKIPITNFHIYHSDGTWNMPEEYETRENHPYKYGYGKLMHSGYHFVDLISWIAETNKKINPRLHCEISSRTLSPLDHYVQISGNKTYQSFFGETTQKPRENLGELDCYLQVLFSQPSVMKKASFVSYGTVDLLQSGLSQRADFKINRDTYKGNGRIRHEQIILNIGPLCSIHLHSYQSTQVGVHTGHDVGQEDHIDVYIFRNVGLIGGKEFEQIQFGKNDENDYTERTIIRKLGHNEMARYTIFKQFISDAPSKVDIAHQLLTNKILAAVQETFSTRRKKNVKI